MYTKKTIIMFLLMFVAINCFAKREICNFSPERIDYRECDFLNKTVIEGDLSNMDFYKIFLAYGMLYITNTNNETKLDGANLLSVSMVMKNDSAKVRGSARNFTMYGGNLDIDFEGVDVTGMNLMSYSESDPLIIGSPDRVMVTHGYMDNIDGSQNGINVGTIKESGPVPTIYNWTINVVNRDVTTKKDTNTLTNVNIQGNIYGTIRFGHATIYKNIKITNRRKDNAEIKVIFPPWTKEIEDIILENVTVYIPKGVKPKFMCLKNGAKVIYYDPRSPDVGLVNLAEYAITYGYTRTMTGLEFRNNELVITGDQPAARVVTTTPAVVTLAAPVSILVSSSTLGSSSGVHQSNTETHARNVLFEGCSMPTRSRVTAKPPKYPKLLYSVVNNKLNNQVDVILMRSVVADDATIDNQYGVVNRIRSVVHLH